MWEEGGYSQKLGPCKAGFLRLNVGVIWQASHQQTYCEARSRAVLHVSCRRYVLSLLLSSLTRFWVVSSHAMHSYISQWMFPEHLLGVSHLQNHRGSHWEMLPSAQVSSWSMRKKTQDENRYTMGMCASSRTHGHTGEGSLLHTSQMSAQISQGGPPHLQPASVSRAYLRCCFTVL